MRDLDRFSEGIKDPQEARTVCDCDSCGSEIYEGAALVTSEVTELDSFCSASCLLTYIGATESEA